MILFLFFMSEGNTTTANPNLEVLPFTIIVSWFLYLLPHNEAKNIP